MEFGLYLKKINIAYKRNAHKVHELLQPQKQNVLVGAIFNTPHYKY